MLAHAFPSSPTRPPLYGIRIHGRNQQTWHFTFSANYSARHFLNSILDTTDHKWVTHEEIEIFSPPLTITCEQPEGLDKIMGHKLTAEEAAYTLPMPYPAQIAQMLGRSYFAAHEPAALSPDKPKQKPAKARQKRPLADSTAKPKHDASLISLDQLTKDPKAARNILRKANYPKPTSGKWLFTAEEAEAVKKVLKP